MAEPWLGSWAELRATYARLRAEGVTGPISRQQAMSAGERVEAAAEATTGDVLTATGFVAERKEGRQICDPNSQAARAKEAGVSVYTQRKLDRLARHRPDLLEAVKAGRMSAHKAAVEAKIVSPPSPLTQLRRWWGAASEADRRTFLSEIRAQEAA